jgi:broad specificity phosphatase PhoE
MERLILARHGESVFSARLLVNGDVAVAGPLTPRGREEATTLGRALEDERIDLCATSEFERTRETADLALAGRDVPNLVLADLNDPLYGSYEGGALEDYRTWAASVGSDATAPGGGESRHAIVERYARGFRGLRERAEQTVLAVVHSLPIAYMLAAKAGDPPGRRVPLVEHAHPYPFAARDVDLALAVLDSWLEAPTW